MKSENISSHAHLKTGGRTIPWASFYDKVVWLLSFGKGADIRKKTIQLAKIKPGEKILDVGCGTGDLTLAAKAATGDTGLVYGIDATPKMIDIAKEKATKTRIDVCFQVGLVENMDFPENIFDVVLSSLMMHHLPDELKRAGLGEILRVLKPGGRLLIVDIQSTTGGSFGKRLTDLMIQLHGGHAAMLDNVTKQIPGLESAGFINIQSGKIDRQFSFIKSMKPDPII